MDDELLVAWTEGFEEVDVEDEGENEGLGGGGTKDGGGGITNCDFEGCCFEGWGATDKSVEVIGLRDITVEEGLEAEPITGMGGGGWHSKFTSEVFRE